MIPALANMAKNMHNCPVHMKLPADTIWSVAAATKVRKEIRNGEFLLIVTINFSNLIAYDARF